MIFIADNTATFQSLFSTRLEAMLQPDAFGAFILVLANSLQDEASRSVLSAALSRSWQHLRSRIDAPGVSIAPDDDRVFRKLETIGPARLSAWRTALQGDWEINLNPMRALRPPRASVEVVSTLYRRFDAGGFNFNKPFLAPEILWEGDWRDCSLRVLYNKFPFAPYHLLLVPQPQLEQPQYLAREYHELISVLAGEMAACIPGFAIAFSSIGAGASVNQLHFQSFVRETPLPVELDKWNHNGAHDAYPLTCTRFDDAGGAWRRIEELHQANNAYNLLYREKACYVIERRLQSDDHIDPDIRGAGWTEACGVFNVPDERTQQSLGADTLTRRLQSLACN